MLDNKEGVIYARVSSAKQVRDGNGLENQIRACKRLADEKNIKIIAVFEDQISGKETDRPGFNELTNFLSSRKGYTYVIFDDLSRFMRNKEEYYPTKLFIKRLGGIPLSIKNNFDENDPYQAFLEHMVVGMNDLERVVSNNRVKSRQKEGMHAGKYMFPVPAGYIWKNGKIRVDNHNAPLIKQIYKDFVSGKYSTYKEIIDSDEAKSLINPATRKGYSLTSDQIKGYLTNKLYTGIIDYPQWEIFDAKGIHESIIDNELFIKAQHQLSVKGKKRHTKISLDEFPLKGHLICGDCNRNLVASASTGRSKKKYPYYRCNSKGVDCSSTPKNILREVVHDQFLNILDNASINKPILKLAEKIINDVYAEKSYHLQGIKKNNRATIKDLEQIKSAQINKLKTVNNSSVIKSLDKEITSIDNEINDLKQLEQKSNDLQAFKLSGQEILTNPRSYWLKGTTEQKKVLFDFVFDKSLEIRNGKVGTAPYSLPYRLLSKPVIEKESMVEPVGIEPTTSSVQGMRSPS